MELTARRVLSTFAFATLGLLSFAAWAQSPAPTRPGAYGKNLRGRWGFGLANIGPGQTPTLSADWHVTQASGFEFDLGVDTSSNANLMSLAARFNRNLFIEDHLLYYLYLGAGLISQQVADENASGYLVEAGTAAKFFLAGLPNLGLSLGGGLRLESLGGVRFRTVLNGGMHYYF